MIYRFNLISDEVDDFKLEIQIDSDDTFLSLRNVILDAAGYTKDQMDSFIICDEEWNKEKEVTLTDMGADSDEDIWLMDERVTAFIGTMTAQALGLKGTQGTDEQISISTPDTANMAIGAIDAALKSVSRQRADLGAYQNRFEMASNGIAVAAENMQGAESGIRDTDMAAEMVEYTKNSILAQSGTAMLAQANSQSQNVLALLQ